MCYILTVNRGKQQVKQTLFNKLQNPSSCKNTEISSRGLLLRSNINHNSFISSAILAKNILEILENKIRIGFFKKLYMKYFNCSKFFFLIFKHDQIKHLFYLGAAEYFYHVSLGGARLPVSSSSSAFGMSAQRLTPRWACIHKRGSTCYSWRKYQEARLRLDQGIKTPTSKM